VKHSTKYLLGIFLGLILVLSAVSGHAQDEDKIKATIPFNFVVGNEELKAGDYVIVSSLANQALLFRSKDGDVQQMAFNVPIETNKTGNHEHLLFHRYGDQYFLSQVWLSGDEDGHELVREAQQKTTGANQAATAQAVTGQ
jgi:hypothetical protein